MIRSIKTKITIITIGIFIVFNIVIIALQVNSYLNYKQLQLDNYNTKVSQFKYYTELTTQNLTNLAQTLALMGSSYSRTKNENIDDLVFYVKHNLEKFSEASGCGIWFEPDIINHKKNFFAFAYKDDNEIKIETLNRKNAYNYFIGEWYLGTKENLNVQNLDNIYWSKPYPDPLTEEQYMITASTIIVNKQKEIIGVASADWLLKDVTQKLYDIAPTDDSIVLFANRKRDFIITLKDEHTSRKYPNFKNYTGKSLKNLKWYNDNLKNGDIKRFGTKLYKTFICNVGNDMDLILEIPIYAIYGIQRRNVLIGFVVQLLGAIIFIYFIRNFILNNLNKPIDILIEAAKKIGQGDFDTKIQINNPKEFAQLANTFNLMTIDIKEYMAYTKKLNSEKNQIELDLNVAKEIQKSSLPSIYPNFYNIPSIDISPYMEMATKVGGDFYDFYFSDKDHIVFTIADVSGKGIPAALFMMSTKTLFKSILLTNTNIEITIKKVNSLICSNNEQELFVTAGIGIIDLRTGVVTYLNAGHNPPIIKHADKIEYLKVPSNIVLGAFEDATFEIIRFKLEPTDTLFLYTDGVTEARNVNHELYGTKRLLEIIRQAENPHINITSVVKNDLKEYINNSEQADDITMLGITYLGNENTCLHKKFMCKIEELDTLKNWIKNFADSEQIDNEKLAKLYIASEEVFVNLCDYAYPMNIPEKEKVVNIGLKYIKSSKEINLVFIDYGIKYNPLELSDPDTDIDISEREEGGMGIMMVKNMMDNVEYEYNGKHNNLKLTYHV